MGIINVTPDSFSDGGEFFNADRALHRAITLQENGADIIDIGGQSTKPDSIRITAEEEWRRLKNVLNAIRGKISVPISVDTFYPEVAERASQAGADIINDVSGVVTPAMAGIVQKTGCGWIITHNSAGTPEEIKEFFTNSATACVFDYNIKKAQLCFDPGIGFGKSYEEDITLISNVDKYRLNAFPLLIGVSRKRVIGRGSGQNIPNERIYGNIAADTIAICGGANIIRLHDVMNEKQGIRMADELKKARL